METFTEHLIGTIIRHKTLSIVSSCIFIIIIISIAVANGINSAVKKSESERYNAEGSVSISNLDQYQKHKPSQEWLDYLNQDLYKTLNYNSDHIIENGSITDATIRDQSYSEEYNSKTQTYSVAYLIDIPSLQQSYFIKYNWSPDAHSSLVPGPSTYCPTPKQLIYPEFDCHDYYIYQTDGNKTYANYADRFITHITPFSTTLDNKVSFTAKRKFKNDTPYIEVVFNICDAGNYVEDAKAVLKKRAEDNNLDISDYRVDFNITKCDYYDYSNM